MPANDDNMQAGRTRPKLSELRTILADARETDDAERIHVALIEVVEGLLDRVEEQDTEIQVLVAKGIKP